MMWVWIFTFALPDSWFYSEQKIREMKYRKSLWTLEDDTTLKDSYSFISRKPIKPDPASIIMLQHRNYCNRISSGNCLQVLIHRNHGSYRHATGVSLFLQDKPYEVLLCLILRIYFGTPLICQGARLEKHSCYYSTATIFTFLQFINTQDLRFTECWTGSPRAVSGSKPTRAQAAGSLPCRSVASSQGH